MSASKIFLCFCLFFIGGIFIGSVFNISQPASLGFLILGIFLISVLWRYKKIAVFGFGILFLVLGIWRHQSVELRFINNELRKLNNLEEKITLIGIVSEEPDIREKSQKLTVKTEYLNDTEAEGKVLVTVNKYPEYNYGDRLKIIGKLAGPSKDIESFSYQDYLKKDGIVSLMSFPEMELVGSGLGNSVMKAIFFFKDKFQVACRNFIPPPQEGILEALIFGEENNIPQEFKDKLNLTGTRHITAVSGMNITILSALILSFALSCGLWRSQAFYFSVILLIIYILMIGAPASALRAGLMALLFLTAQHFGRLSSAPRAVVFAAALMLAQNPFLLRLDVGFQLSFLALMGIIFLQPAINNYFSKIPNLNGFPLRTTLAATLSAQFFTWPILVYNFGYIPLLSPAINILIVPFLAPLTILIFIFGLSAIFFFPSGYFLSWIVWLGLTYVVKLVEWFSQVSWASLGLKNLPPFWLIISYLILGVITWRLQEKQKLKFLHF